MTTPSPPDWRGLCQELVKALQAECRARTIGHDLMAAYIKADAALAQPEPEVVGPSDESVEAAAQVIYGSMRFDRVDSTSDWVPNGNSFAQDEARRCAHAVLARFGRPAPAPAEGRQAAPVPVAMSERLPGDQLCWWYEPDEEDESYGSRWTLLRIRGNVSGFTHWLPATALPLPAGEVE